MMRRVIATTVVLLVAVTGLVLGPAFLRRDLVSYRWAGTIGETTLIEPIGVAYVSGRLLVSDAATNRVLLFDTTGTSVGTWGDSAVQLLRPMHLSAGPNGLVRVAEYLADRVSVLDTTGAVVGVTGGATGSGLGQLDAPGGAAFLNGAVFVAEFYNHRVQAFAGGKARVIGQPGRLLKGSLHYPTDVATDDSLIYVADAYNHRIQVFRPNGEYVRRWGGPFGFGGRGPFRGWFRVATGVEVDGGQVYVADFHNNRVQIFTDRGRYLGQITDSLRLPTDVAVGPEGQLYVADFGHGRVVQFAPERNGSR
jgi:DNA-binding beta-propeller fold protein YncE